MKSDINGSSSSVSRAVPLCPQMSVSPLSSPPELNMIYKACPDSIQPWCNLADSQRRPYCSSVNSHFPVGLVSRQWDAVDWACVLCDCRIHNGRRSRSVNFHQCACPFYSSRAGLCQSMLPRSVSPQPRFGSLCLLAFPKVKIAVEKVEICECDGHTAHKLNRRRLTADWLALRESDCSRMDSKVYSDWLPGYTKTIRPACEIFKMAGYFPDSPRNLS